MTIALIISSYVASSRIGGVVQQLALSRLEMDPILVPTVMFGRSPAFGGVGQPVPPEAFEAMLAEVEADGGFEGAELAILGYFVSAEQVAIAAEAVHRLRAASPGVVVVVDPIMGDSPKGLYVKEHVAEAVGDILVPLADWITPNAWELSLLSGQPVEDGDGALAAAQLLERPLLVTGVPTGEGEIAALIWDGHEGAHFIHRRAGKAPNGLGDLVTAVFAAGLAEALGPLAAARWALRAALKAVDAGVADLPVGALGEALLAPDSEVRVEPLD
jgi:pyridoxine kinase